MASWTGEPPYPYAWPFRPKARTVTTWVLRTRTPAGMVDVPTDQATADELVAAECSWHYLYARNNGRPHTVVLLTDSLPKARQDRLQRVLSQRGMI
jgi:hypothetical protein